MLLKKGAKSKAGLKAQENGEKPAKPESEDTYCCDACGEMKPLSCRAPRQGNLCKHPCKKDTDCAQKQSKLLGYEKVWAKLRCNLTLFRAFMLMWQSRQGSAVGQGNKPRPGAQGKFPWAKMAKFTMSTRELESANLISMKMMAGFCKWLQEEAGLSPKEAMEEWEHRKARPDAFRQDHSGFKGATRIELETESFTKTSTKVVVGEKLEAGRDMKKPKVEMLNEMKASLLGSVEGKKIKDASLALNAMMKFEDDDDVDSFESAVKQLKLSVGDSLDISKDTETPATGAAGDGAGATDSSAGSGGGIVPSAGKAGNNSTPQKNKFVFEVKAEEFIGAATTEFNSLKVEVQKHMELAQSAFDGANVSEVHVKRTKMLVEKRLNALKFFWGGNGSQEADSQALAQFGFSMRK